MPLWWSLVCQAHRRDREAARLAARVARRGVLGPVARHDGGAADAASRPGHAPHQRSLLLDERLAAPPFSLLRRVFQVRYAPVVAATR